MLTLFGFASVSLMLIAYALEERAPAFVALFAVACGASSIYGFLAGTWPFGIVEAVWGLVALRRWRLRVTSQSQRPSRPIACNMTALSADERRCYDMLRQLVLGSVRDVMTTATGFRLDVEKAASPQDIAEWMTLEHRCCPFLTLELTLKHDGTSWLEMGGNASIKNFLREEFKPLTSALSCKGGVRLPFTPPSGHRMSLAPGPLTSAVASARTPRRQRRREGAAIATAFGIRVRSMVSSAIAASTAVAQPLPLDRAVISALRWIVGGCAMFALSFLASATFEG